MDPIRVIEAQVPKLPPGFEHNTNGNTLAEGGSAGVVQQCASSRISLPSFFLYIRSTLRGISACEAGRVQNWHLYVPAKRVSLENVVVDFIEERTAARLTNPRLPMRGLSTWWRKGKAVARKDKKSGIRKGRESVIRHKWSLRTPHHVAKPARAILGQTLIVVGARPAPFSCV